MSPCKWARIASWKEVLGKRDGRGTRTIAVDDDYTPNLMRS